MAQRYRAFISYAHDDADTALWLHRALERYRLPKALQAKNSGSAHLRPIFRDEDELSSAASLSATLRDALDQSDALIVLCSPAAASSRWVNEEIQAFLGGASDRTVIPVLVDGGSLTPEPVFPPALLISGAEPLAIDLRLTGEGSRRSQRRNALQKVISGLLDVPFDTVRMREQEWRRRVLVSTSAAGSSVALMLVAGTYLVMRLPECLPREALTAELWSPVHQQEVYQAMEVTGLSFFTRTWSAVDESLSSYADAWSAVHLEACEAHHVHKRQSESLLDKRMACLDERRQDFVALREELAAVDSDSLELALPSVEGLKGLARCSDREALEAAYPPPDNPDDARASEALGSVIARTRAQLRAGHVEQALAQAGEHVTQAERIRFPPLEANALILLADAYRSAARPREAEETYLRAAAKSVQARDPELAAYAWLRLPQIGVRLNKGVSHAEQQLTMAASYVEQLPPESQFRGWLLRQRGMLLVQSGDHDDGVRLLRDAVEFARTNDLQALPEYLDDLSWGLLGMYRLEEAETVSEESLVLMRDKYGADHPLYAGALRQRSRIASRRGDDAAAIDLLEAAMAIIRETHPPNHPRSLVGLNDTAWSLKNLGRWEEASRHLDEAIRVQGAMEEPQYTILGSSHNIYADLHMSREEYARARAHLERAIEYWTHPDGGMANANLGIAYNNLGNLSNREGRFKEAREHCERALAFDVDQFGEDFTGTAFPLSCLGEAYTGLGRLEEAIAVLERAHALREAPGMSPSSLAWSRWLLGRALWEAEADRARARSYIEFAYNQFSADGAGAASETADIQRWMKQHDFTRGD